MSEGIRCVNSSQNTTNSSGTFNPFFSSGRVPRRSNTPRGKESFKARSDYGANELKKDPELK